MTETAKSPSASDERPIFRVVSGTFATGVKLYAPGEEIVWAIPEGWDDKKYGKHFAAYGPSLTFEPLNQAAEKRMEEHKKLVAEKNQPKPTRDDERAAKLEKLVLDMLNAQGEAQAEARRAQARHEELMEKLVAAQEKKR